MDSDDGASPVDVKRSEVGVRFGGPARRGVLRTGFLAARHPQQGPSGGQSVTTCGGRDLCIRALPTGRLPVWG